jgi:hypothetical protein
MFSHVLQMKDSQLQEMEWGLQELQDVRAAADLRFGFGYGFCAASFCCLHHESPAQVVVAKNDVISHLMKVL